MFYYNNHRKFSNEYLPNAMKINVKHFKCELNKQTAELEFRLSGLNNSFYFNKEGLLLETTRYTKYRVTKEVYTYNKRNKPISVLSFNCLSNLLNCIIILTYDNNDRIINEEVLSVPFYENNLVTQEEYFHEFDSNTHTITFEKETGKKHWDEHDYDEWIFEEELNDSGQVIEFKSSSKLDGPHLWSKYYYSDVGELICEANLDENSKIISETVYDKNNTVVKYNKKDVTDNLVFEDIFEYNERGHWIKQFTLKNGELFFIIEKTIVYYL